MKEPIGKMRAGDVALALDACGERELAAELRALASDETLDRLIAAEKWTVHPWEHTEFSCAYLGPGPYSDPWGYLADATSIDPDPSLAGATLNVTLDKLRVYQYPGGGQHQILLISAPTISRRTSRLQRMSSSLRNTWRKTAKEQGSPDIPSSTASRSRRMGSTSLAE